MFTLLSIILSYTTLGEDSFDASHVKSSKNAEFLLNVVGQTFVLEIIYLFVKCIINKLKKK